MGIINIGQADNVIEENQAGDIVANLDVVNAGSVSATSIDTDALGHGMEDLTDVTGSRSFDTEYQNTDSTNRLVSVRAKIDGSTSAQTMNFTLGYSNTSGIVSVDRQEQDVINSYDSVYKTALTIIVPPGGYYKCESFADETLDDWREAQFV